MKLIICSKHVYEEKGSIETTRFPIGELFQNEEDGVWQVLLYLDPNIEYLIVEQSDTSDKSKGRTFAMYSLKPIEEDGIDHVIEYRIGKIRVTPNGGVFMNLNLLPCNSYQILDLQKIMST